VVKATNFFYIFAVIYCSI